MARSAALVAVLLLGYAAFIQASGDPTESLPGVQDLTPDNFDKIVNGAKAALVEFYAPWCGHCKHLVPEYKKLGELVQNDPKLKNRVVITKVNADSHRSLGDKFEVRGFPTIKWLPRGKAATKDNAVDYNSARTAEKMLEYIKEKLEADKGFARVEALSDVVKGFKDAKDPKAVLKQVQAKVADLTGDDAANGAVYVKVLEKAVEKGVSYLATEKARVDKMLTGGSVSAAKADEMTRKSSVIGHILGDDEEDEE